MANMNRWHTILKCSRSVPWHYSLLLIVVMSWYGITTPVSRACTFVDFSTLLYMDFSKALLKQRPLNDELDKHWNCASDQTMEQGQCAGHNWRAASKRDAIFCSVTVLNLCGVNVSSAILNHTIPNPTVSCWTSQVYSVYAINIKEKLSTLKYHCEQIRSVIK